MASTPKDAPEATEPAPAATPDPFDSKPLSVILAEVSRQVGHVAKDRQAPGNIGGFMFRGVDAVVNAVHPVLTARGVIVVPEVLEHHREAVSTKAGGTMMNVTVRTRWTFHGPKGDTLSLVTLGEAADAGDKASSKAQSVALRVALLQALLLPTDEPDPDETGYERAGAGMRTGGSAQRTAQPGPRRAGSDRGPEHVAPWWDAFDALAPDQQAWVRANWPDARRPQDLDREGVSQALEWLAANCPPAANPPA